jgi:hypothetical protein
MYVLTIWRFVTYAIISTVIDVGDIAAKYVGISEGGILEIHVKAIESHRP